MQLVIEIEAKLKLLRYLQSEYSVDKQVIAGAIAKLGSDVCNAIPGALGDQIEQYAQQKATRLESKNFEAGDTVRLEYMGKEETFTVGSATKDQVTFNNLGAVSVAKCTSTELGELHAILLACAAARGI